MILDYFPAHLEPRAGQRFVLTELEKNIDKADVFVIEAPTAFGKTNVMMTIAKFMKKASIISPTNLLLEQYKREYPRLHILPRREDYVCTTQRVKLTEREGSCPKKFNCEGCEKYKRDMKKNFVMPYLAGNYYSYLANKAYRSNLIVDEAHSLIPFVKELNSKVLWKHKYNYPDNVKTYADLLRWLERLHTYQIDDNLSKLYKELTSQKQRFIVREDYKLYRGQERPCLLLLPIDVSDEAPLLWPSSVKKLFLLSATISYKDVEQLGLKDKRVMFIKGESPIPPERRPVIIDKSRLLNLSFRHQQENAAKLAELIKDVAAMHPNEKGLVHITYGLKTLIQPYLIDSDRFIFHNKDNKKQRFNEFRESAEPKILIASGLYEGIDLPYDLGRWQILTKIPWPSLAEPAIKYKAEQDKEYYAWETIKTVLQACGRISRTVDDFGTTYVVDSTFLRLYSEHKSLWPAWFKSAVQISD